MPYARRTSYRRPYRRPYRRYARKSPVRRTYPARRRTTSRRRSGMSRKSLLNITSRKKQDTMLVVTNTTASTPVGGPQYLTQTATLVGGLTYVIPWIATARDNTLSPGSGGTISDKDTRTAMTCYMRGLKERIQIQTNSGMPWQWRRICFTVKGDGLTQRIESAYRLFYEDSAGWRRLVNNIRSSNMNAALNDVLFQGTDGKDWNNYFNAKVDRTRVTVRYDKTTSIRSGNAEGMMREYQRWHPMNHNLVYDDEEDGGGIKEQYFSTTGKAGMGDYYVVDFISAGSDATTADVLTFNPQATLYWHEK